MAERTTRRRHVVLLEVVGDQKLRTLEAQAQRLGATVNRLNRNASRSGSTFGRMGSATGALGRQMQNAAFQVGDFAVQIASGTAASRAFAQQAPQLLGGFGLLGAALGAAVAVGAALAPVIKDIGASAGSASALLGSFNPVVEALVAGFQALQPIATGVISSLVNNLDRLLFYASAAVALFGTRWVASFVAARVAALSLAASLAAVRVALIRLGVGAVIVGAGELALQFSRLVQGAGGLGEALALVADVGREAFERIGTAGKALQASLSAIWLTVYRSFVGALNNMRAAWAAFLGILAAGASQIADLEFLGETPFEGFADPFVEAAEKAKKGVEATNVQLERLGGVIDDNRAAAAAFTAELTAPMVSVDRLLEVLRSAKDETINLSDVWKTLGNDIDAAGEGAGGGGGGALKKLTDDAREAQRELGEIGRTIETGFGSAFRSLIDGTKSARDAFADMITGIAADIATFLASQQLKNFLLALSNVGGFGFLQAPATALGGTARGALAQPFALTPRAPVPAPWFDGLGSHVARVVGSAAPASPSPAGYGGSGLNVVVNNNTAADVAVSEQRDSTGQRSLQIDIDQRVASALRRGPAATVLSSEYGLRRRTR